MTLLEASRSSQISVPHQSRFFVLMTAPLLFSTILTLRLKPS